MIGPVFSGRSNGLGTGDGREVAEPDLQDHGAPGQPGATEPGRHRVGHADHLPPQVGGVIASRCVGLLVTDRRVGRPTSHRPVVATPGHVVQMTPGVAPRQATRTVEGHGRQVADRAHTEPVADGPRSPGRCPRGPRSASDGGRRVRRPASPRPRPDPGRRRRGWRSAWPPRRPAWRQHRWWPRRPRRTGRARRRSAVGWRSPMARPRTEEPAPPGRRRGRPRPGRGPRSRGVYELEDLVDPPAEVAVAVEAGRRRRRRAGTAGGPGPRAWPSGSRRPAPRSWPRRPHPAGRTPRRSRAGRRGSDRAAPRPRRRTRPCRRAGWSPPHRSRRDPSPGGSTGDRRLTPSRR